MSEKHYPYVGGSFDRIVFDGDGSLWVPEPDNAKLLERITTQKQTIQAYRDESREWREVAEHAQAENAKLRTQLADATESMRRVEERCVEERCAKLRECFPAEMGKNRGRICPTCGCIVFDDEECCPDCNAEVDG